MIKRLLIKKAKKAYLEEQERDVVVSAEKIYFIEDLSRDYHCSDGVFNKDDLERKDTIIKSSIGKEFFIIEANFLDSYKGIRKSAQTIPLKDLGFIIVETGLNKNSVVLDAGTGSGGSACLLAKYAKRVYSYDISQSNLDHAKKNAEYFNIKNITFRQQDISKKTPKNLDFALLDLPEPWKAINTVYECLKPGAFLVAYCPQITQTQQFVNKALEKNLLHTKTVEIVERDWKIEGQIVRPKSLSNIHSGFITVLRKIL